MLFNSYAFLFGYLPVVLVVFFLIAGRSHRMAAAWLAAASLFFYGWWNPKFVLLLLGSIAFNFVVGYGIARLRALCASPARAKALLALAIFSNLAILGYFKYTNFFIGTANHLWSTDWPLLGVILPLGISFYTFTQIAFLVDVYRGIAREYNAIHYVLFVTYFPHLIAGPVLHHKQMMPQFEQQATYRLNLENLSKGLAIFALGLFKKTVLADHFATYATPVFDAAAMGARPTLLEAWVGALAYTLQLYFDFSGYSDMAIGLSWMFNIQLPLNFNSPYKATNIIDFWRRWHMTLSTFLRDYLYIPLGGNRSGTSRRYANLLATMILGGLWHGANWTFVFWGFLHGIYLVINHGWRAIHNKLRLPRILLPPLLSGVLTFTAVVIAWVPFRSADIGSAVHMVAGMFGFNGITLPPRLEVHMATLQDVGIQFVHGHPSLPLVDAGLWIALGLAIVWLLPNTQNWVAEDQSDHCHTRATTLDLVRRYRPNLVCGLFVGSILWLALMMMGKPSEFLYFQF